MRKMIFIALLTAACSTAVFASEFVAEGKTFSFLGDYKIDMAANPVILNGEKMTTFVISYQNTPLTIRVAVQKEKDGNKYFVLSDKLCVQYVCNANYFGVERLDKSFEKEGYATSDKNLNRNEYFHQKVLTSGRASELDNTRLIASYFPMLLNDKSDAVAVR